MLKKYLLENCIVKSENLDETIEKFKTFEDFLLEQNKLFNLTAITDPEEIEQKHFIDSLTAYPYIRGNILDIGSGAGFPSIPLKIVLPQNSFTLVDSLSKRVNFLTETIKKLQLQNVSAVHTRIEDFHPKEAFETVVARAVAKTVTLCEYALPFVKTGGLMIAYKTLGDELSNELKEAQTAIDILGGRIEEIISTKVDNQNHALVLIRKIHASPEKYPRKGNKPRTQPLGM